MSNKREATYGPCLSDCGCYTCMSWYDDWEPIDAVDWTIPLKDLAITRDPQGRIILLRRPAQ